MNYTELKAAILSDTHRSDYTTFINRFVEQAEALIGLSLEGYFLEAVIDETDRVIDGTYTLPAKVTAMRTVIYDERTLVRTDETNVIDYKDDSVVHSYCMRDTTIVFAGIPPEDAEISLYYFGLPAALTDAAPTNNLLTDCPQLYIEAAQVYLFKRMRNFPAADSAMSSVQFMINELNRKMKKKLGGAQSANPYNVYFRSSY
jgi:hypothetical protein